MTRLLLLLGLAAPLAAQAPVHLGHAATPEVALRLWVPRGTLRVTTWVRDSVDIRGRTDGDAQLVRFGGGPSALKLAVEPAGGDSAAAAVDLEVRIPTRARLWVTSAEADLDITASGGPVDVTTVSGRVRVAGTPAAVSVETIDGNVELACSGPLAQVRTASGVLVVRGVLQELDARSVSGPLYVGMEGAVGQVHLETVSSEIAFKGALVPAGRLLAETHGGDIELRLPAGLAASWRLVSYRGPQADQLLPRGALRAGADQGEWIARTGDGQATVDVRTFKGRIALKVRQ